MKSTPENERDGGPQQLSLNFRGARLETVLDHLHKSAGVPIGIKSGVQLGHRIDLCHDQPVTKAEALSLLKQRLMQVGCTLIQKGAMFCIMRIEEAKKTCIALPAI